MGEHSESIGEVVRFKYRVIGEDGTPHGLLRSRGRVTGEALELQDFRLPLASIISAERRLGRFIITFRDEHGDRLRLVLEVPRRTIRKLLPALIAGASLHAAEVRQMALEARGMGDAFRIDVCPECDATIDLSGRDESPQVYCPFCDTISDVARDARRPLKGYRLCSGCGMFARPKEYTVLYFYFLFVIWGVRHRRTYLCQRCMRREAWKMLLCNLPFVLGVPVAVGQLARSYFSRVGHLPELLGLNRANAAANWRDIGRIDAAFAPIYERAAACAGVRYNHGLALLNAGEPQRANEQFRRALHDCANYEPAVHGLMQGLRMLDDHHACRQLIEWWTLGETGDGEDPTAADALTSAASEPDEPLALRTRGLV